MSDLRNKLTKLAKEQPQFQRHLVPLLRQAAVDKSWRELKSDAMFVLANATAVGLRKLLKRKYGHAGKEGTQSFWMETNRTFFQGEVKIERLSSGVHAYVVFGPETSALRDLKRNIRVEENDNGASLARALLPGIEDEVDSLIS